MAKREIWRGSAGRVMLELLYGQGTHICHAGSGVKVELTPLAQTCKLRADRLRDTILWLERQNLVKDLEWLPGNALQVTLLVPEFCKLAQETVKSGSKKVDVQNTPAHEWFDDI